MSQKPTYEELEKKTEEIFTEANPVQLFMPDVQKIFHEGQPYHWEVFLPIQFLNSTKQQQRERWRSGTGILKPISYRTSLQYRRQNIK